MTPVDIREPGAARPRAAPRALILDLDGTTISRGAFLHPRTAEAVRAATAKLPVVVATGRQYVSAMPWVHELGVTEPVVCYEGALVRGVVDVAGNWGPVLLERTLPAEAALRTLQLAREHNWHVHAYDREQLVAERDRPELRLYTDVAGVQARFVAGLEPVLERGTPKMVCVIENPAEVRRCMRLLRHELGARARVTQSREPYVEVVSADVSKSNACDLVCWRRGIALKDTVCIGDAPNDIDVLDRAGFAIAVDAGRYPNVLKHADATIRPPTDGGVADALEALGLA